LNAENESVCLIIIDSQACPEYQDEGAPA